VSAANPALSTSNFDNLNIYCGRPSSRVNKRHTTLSGPSRAEFVHLAAYHGIRSSVATRGGDQLAEGRAAIPAGWYRDPGSFDQTTMRWWNGTEWSDQVKLVSMSPPSEQRKAVPPLEIESNPSESSAGSARWRVYVVSRVLEVATVLLIFAARSAPLVAVGFSVSAVTLVLELVLLRWRRRVGPVSGGAVLLQLIVGLLGLVWFVAIVILAVINLVGRRGQ
jgi:hypothetical protein